MGLPEKLAFWETYMQVKKQQLELDMKQWTGSKLGMEFIKALCWHPAYLTFIQDTLCEMPGWMKHTLISRLLREILNQIHRWCYPYGRKWRGIKKSLGEGERGEWKIWLKTQHSKMKIMASGRITSWQIMASSWGNNGNSDRLYFLGSKITVDSNWSYKIKRHLLLGRKEMMNLPILFLVAQSCLTLWDCSLSGSSVHGDSPGNNTGVGCHAHLKGIFQSRDWTQVSCIEGRFLFNP